MSKAFNRTSCGSSEVTGIRADGTVCQSPLHSDERIANHPVSNQLLVEIEANTDVAFLLSDIALICRLPSIFSLLLGGLSFVMSFACQQRF